MKRILAVVLLAVLLMTGCASTQEKLVGKWEREGDRLTLNEDLSGELTGTPISWLYANDELQMIYSDGMSVSFTVEFDGADNLTLTTIGDYGMTAEFRRVED